MAVINLFDTEPDSKQDIKKYAQRLLRAADVGDRLPTPQDDILSCAELVLSGTIDLDDYKESFFQKAGNALISGLGKILGILDVREKIIIISPDTSDSKKSIDDQAKAGPANDALKNSQTSFLPKMQQAVIKEQTLQPLEKSLKTGIITALSEEEYEFTRKSLDAFEEEIEGEIRLGKTILGSAMATSVGLSAGYVVWLIKGGSLLASVLSSLPYCTSGQLRFHSRQMVFHRTHEVHGIWQKPIRSNVQEAGYI